MWNNKLPVGHIDECISPDDTDMRDRVRKALSLGYPSQYESQSAWPREVALCLLPFSEPPSPHEWYDGHTHTLGYEIPSHLSPTQEVSPVGKEEPHEHVLTLSFHKEP